MVARSAAASGHSDAIGADRLDGAHRGALGVARPGLCRNRHQLDADPTESHDRAGALARWNLDWAIGVVFQKLVDKGVAANYGAEMRELMLDAPLGPDGARLVMYALPNSRDFLIERTRTDLINIRNKEDQKMRDLAPFAKGKYQSTKGR